MRRATTILAACSVLALSAVSATAATSGATCRSACAPRIAEQCSGRVGAELRRCRRPLLRACKASAPERACPTSADLARALSGRALGLTDGTTLRLCRDGRFALDASVGEWGVVVTADGLAIELVAGAAPARRLPIAPAGDGGFLVDREPAQVGTTDGCEPFVNGRDLESMLALARVLSDRQIAWSREDEAGRLERHEITLCSSGVARAAWGSSVASVEARGTWTIAGSGTTLVLAFDGGGLPPSHEVTVLEDVGVLVDGELATLRDARASCTALDLEIRFVERLIGTAYRIETTRGDLTGRTTLAFCDAERMVVVGIFGTPTAAGWTVASIDGRPELHLVDDAGAVTPMPLAREADGTVLVRDAAPLDDGAAIVASLCP
jgi:hypothetical protein